MSLRSGLLALARTSGETVMDGDVSGDESARYAVLYSAAGVLEWANLTASADELTVHFQITSVGPRPRDPDVVAARVRDALVGMRPAASGWATGPVRHLSSQVARRDEDRPDATVWFATDQYEVQAARV